MTIKRVKYEAQPRDPAGKVWTVADLQDFVDAIVGDNAKGTDLKSIILDLSTDLHAEVVTTTADTVAAP